MAEQRRYNAEQVRRVQESGERAPEGMSTVGRILRNVAVAIPRGVTDLAAASGMVIPAIRAGLDSDLDFGEAMYGEEGIAEVQSYVETETQKVLDTLPVERRTPANAQAIQDAVRNSSGAQEIMLRNGPRQTRLGMEAGDALNEAVGLGPVRSETIVDDVAQIAGSAIVPSSLITKPLVKAAEKSALGAATKFAADVIVPGTAKYTPAGVATNIGVPLAVSQTLRAATDQPSMYTGDALAADSGVNAAYDPDPVDPDAGLGGEQYAGMAAGAGGLAVAAAVMLGKANKAVMKQIVDPVDTPNVRIPDDELEPSLKTGQHIGAAFDDSAPVRDYLSNAYGGPRSEGYKKHIGDFERVVADTAAVNQSQARDAAIFRGEIAGLDRKTIPAQKLFDTRSRLEPEKAELWNTYIHAMNEMDNHTLKVNSAKEEEQLAAAGLKTKKTPAAVAQHEKMKQSIKELENEEYVIGGGLTVKQVKEMDIAVKADPVLAELTAAHKKIYNDLLDGFVGQKFIAQDGADKMRANRPNYAPEVEDPLGGITGTARFWEYGKRLFGGTDRPKMYGGLSGPIKTRAEAGDRVKNKKDPLAAMQDYIHDYVDLSARNAAKAAITNALRGSPDWGKTIREIHSMPISDFYAKGGSSSLPDKVKKAKLTTEYVENGVYHVIQVADELMHRALQFHRPQTAGWGLNLMRKAAQQGTTGWMAPEFAPISAYFDHQIINATKGRDRSFGMIDNAVRKAFPNSKMVETAMYQAVSSIDPTAHLQTLSGAFSGVTQSALRQLAEKMAADLKSSSGLFSILGKQGGAVEHAAMAMIRTLNDTRYGQAVRAKALDAHLMDDPLRDVRPKYEAVRSVITGPAKALFDMYINSLDAIHNSAKYAFFAQNLALLEKKYPNGVPDIELKRLASETRRSSGDMTRSPGNTGLAKLASSIPYANIAINSSMHLAQMSRRDPVGIGARVLTGAVVPKILAIGAIASVPAINDWYWNELTPWQRMGSIPVIGPSWWMDQALGKGRELKKSDIYLMRETPEIAMISNQVVNGIRAFGWFGPASETNAAYIKDIFRGMEGMTSMGVPPILKAALQGQNLELTKIPYSILTGEPYIQDAYIEEPQQYGNVTGINVDSDWERATANAIGALFGVASQNVINSLDVGTQAYEKGGDIYGAFKKAFEFDTMQRERRLLEIPGTREVGATLYTDGVRRHYAGTTRRLHVAETMQRVDEIKSQLSAEKDTHRAGAVMESQGLDGWAKITDPKVLALARETTQKFGSGLMKSLATDRSALGAEMVLIDANKENMNPRSYHLRSVALRQQVNAIDKQMEDQILNFEASLAQRYGKDMDVSTVLELIEGSLAR